MLRLRVCGRGFDRLLPGAMVGAAVLFNLWALRGELLPAQNLNDGAVHAQMVRWAEYRIGQGHVPLDGWYPYLGLGSSRFHHYQSLPHILTGYLAGLVGAETAFRWSLYLLLSSWPISVFAGARLLGWGRWAAASAALVSPLVVSRPGLGYEHGSYIWRGSGVWGQLWAMWLVPLAWGTSWRAVARGSGYAVAGLALSVTIACHFIAGYLVLLSLGLWVLVRPSELWRRLKRGVLVGGGSLLAASWVLVPLVQDAKWSNQSIYLKDTIFRDSFGAPQVLAWLFSGEIFDRGRLSVLTVLAGVGAVVCAMRFRRDERARVLIGVLILSLILFSGRPTFGFVLDLLPGSQDIFLRRFIIGVHLAGILLAGVGLAWLGRRLIEVGRAVFPRFRPVGAVAFSVALGVAILAPAWTERISYDSRGATLVRLQRLQDLSEGSQVEVLIEEAKARGGGRIYAGRRASWGDDYRVGYVPVYAVLANEDADAVGFTLRTPSLSTDIETLFDETDPTHYDLYAVRYLLLPDDREPLVEAVLLDRAGRHTLWEVPGVGYLDVVDTLGSISASRDDLAVRMRGFLRSPLPGQRVHPTVAFEGDEGAAPTLESRLEGLPGIVESEVSSPTDGLFSGRVEARRLSVAILKATYDPRWTAFVDGVKQPTQMVAPSFVGVQVSPGRHLVTFRYDAYPYYGFLIPLGIGTLLGLALLPRLRRRVRDRPPPEREAGS